MNGKQARKLRKHLNSLKPSERTYHYFNAGEVDMTKYVLKPNNEVEMRTKKIPSIIKECSDFDRRMYKTLKRKWADFKAGNLNDKNIEIDRLPQMEGDHDSINQTSSNQETRGEESAGAQELRTYTDSGRGLQDETNQSGGSQDKNAS